MSCERKNPHIVDKETAITHACVTSDLGFGFRITTCGLQLLGSSWHVAWRTAPNNRVTCVFCLGAADG